LPGKAAVTSYYLIAAVVISLHLLFRTIAAIVFNLRVCVS